MSKKIERIAKDQVLSAVEHAVALERHRIENMPAAGIDTVGGGFDIPSTSPYPDPTPTNTGGAVMPNLPGLPSTQPFELPSTLGGN